MSPFGSISRTTSNFRLKLKNLPNSVRHAPPLGAIRLVKTSHELAQDSPTHDEPATSQSGCVLTRWYQREQIRNNSQQNIRPPNFIKSTQFLGKAAHGGSSFQTDYDAPVPKLMSNLYHLRCPKPSCQEHLALSAATGCQNMRISNLRPEYVL